MRPVARLLTARRSGARALAAALLLLAARAAAEEGVLAELPFLHELPEGEVQQGDIAIDLSPHPGSPFPMILDTGAGHSVLTPGYARAVGVSVRAARDFDRPYRKGTVLGRDLLFRIDVDSSDTGARRFEAGLLGTNFLEHYVVEIDYAAERVRFLDPEIRPVAEDAAEPGEVVVPMVFVDRVPAIEIGLGDAPLRVLVDTGAPLGLLLSEELARERGVEIPPDAPRSRVRNVLGDHDVVRRMLPVVDVGGYPVEQVEASVALAEGAQFRTTSMLAADHGLVGAAFLGRFRVRFDYPHRRAGLLPVAGPPPAAPTAVARAGPAPPAPVPTPLPEVDPGVPARAAAASAEQVWFELDAPAEGASAEGRVAWQEVEGWAGSQRSRAYDVALVIDTSGSTALASGADVDGDGKVGRARKRYDAWRSFNPRHLSSDPGDTVLAAELLATKALVELLDPGRTRIGLVTFADGAHPVAAVGSDRASFADRMEQLEGHFGSGMTNLAAAAHLATEMLLAASEGEPEPPQRVMLILSDGYPTFPGSAQSAARAALDEAAAAAEAGVRIYTFGLALGEEQENDVFVEMAKRTGGHHVRLAEPAEIVRELPRIDLARVASLEIRNATTGEPGRAPRVFPDGSFDAYVRLAPGENVVAVTARGSAGGEARAERRVFFDRREPATPVEAAGVAEEEERLRRALEVRSLETDLAARAARGKARERAPQEKELEVDVEEEDQR